MKKFFVKSPVVERILRATTTGEKILIVIVMLTASTAIIAPFYTTMINFLGIEMINVICFLILIWSLRQKRNKGL